jgi:hypothetical protein
MLDSTGIINIRIYDNEARGMRDLIQLFFLEVNAIRLTICYKTPDKLLEGGNSCSQPSIPCIVCLVSRINSG